MNKSLYEENNNNFLKKINLENNDDIECLVIYNSHINHIDYNRHDYIDTIINLTNIETVKINNNNFNEILINYFNLNNINNDNDLNVKTEIIGDEYEYTYELMYLDLPIKEENDIIEGDINELSTLLNTNGNIIYSNAILFKNYLPSLTDKMLLCNMKKNDIKNILFNRVNNKIIIYDEDNNKFKEDIIRCNNLDFEKYAKEYFDNEFYYKYETKYLMHNINIWYIIEGSNNILDNLINKPISKCIIFTKKTEEFIGNLSLNEFNKIIYLSKKNINDIPSELLHEKLDNLGRKIINNKYKILDYIYNKNI
jgi:hypothetical protein